MTNEQILKKAIEKAVDGGWKDYYEGMLDPYEGIDDYSIIFSHSFAKACWGEKEIHERWGTGPATGATHHFEFTGPEWQYRLQQMVLEEEPLQYIRRFL